MTGNSFIFILSILFCYRTRNFESRNIAVMQEYVAVMQEYIAVMQENVAVMQGYIAVMQGNT